MEIKAVKFGYRCFFRIAFNLCRVNRVTGYCSNVGPYGTKESPVPPREQSHFLLWDFDVPPEHYDLVEMVLMEVQLKYNLPQIDIRKTTNGFHAACFKKCTWRECEVIISATDLVDQMYLAVGITRGYFTLRWTPVPGEAAFKLISFIKSPVPSELSYNDVKQFVDYTKKVK